MKKEVSWNDRDKDSKNAKFIFEATPFSLPSRRQIVKFLLGSLSSDDGDGNENGKKAIGLY